MEDDNWDLFAVVRGCSSIFTTTSSSSPTTNSTAMATTAYPPPPSSFRTQGQQHQDEILLCFSDLYEPRSESSFEELLHDLCKPLVQKPQPLSPHNLSVSPVSVLGGLPDLSQKQQQHQQQLQQPNQRFLGSRASGIPTRVSTTSTRNPASGPRYKRRKNQMKRVCHVAAEGLSSDMWSWRKYGQKPIKGSPYPRGYYRCSTSKICMARKQVERNRSDPGMFIVTYTAEHNHPMPTQRNSLAGSTRQKLVTSPTEAAADTTDQPSCSSPTSPGDTHCPAAEKVASREDREDVADEEDDNFGVSDMAMDDDFFEGLDDLAGTDIGGSLLGDFPVALTFPWLTNDATPPRPAVVDSIRF